MIIPVFVKVVLFGAICTGSAAQPVVVPKSVIAQVGTVARFNCTTMRNEPVYWITKPYGSAATYDIYIGEKFLLDDYGASGRFSVEVNSTLRRYDLVIKEVKQSDGGVYICIDERGLGKKAYAELVVWDTLTYQENQQKDSYMGDNVFGLDQDVISFTCRISYSGNIRPQLEWSEGGRKLNGTQETESGIASSSLILVAASKLDGANVSCEAAIIGNSSEDTRTGVLWTSDIIRVKYAVLKKKVVKECPGVENTLNCNPPCSYTLETVNSAQQCAISYSAGTDVKYFYQSSTRSSETGSVYSIVMTVLAAGSCFVLITLAIGYWIKKLCFWRKREKKNSNERQPTADQDAWNNQQTREQRKDETTAFFEKIPPVRTTLITHNKIEALVIAS